MGSVLWRIVYLFFKMLNMNTKFWDSPWVFNFLHTELFLWMLLSLVWHHAKQCHLQCQSPGLLKPHHQNPTISESHCSWWCICQLLSLPSTTRCNANEKLHCVAFFIVWIGLCSCLIWTWSFNKDLGAVNDAACVCIKIFEYQRHVSATLCGPLNEKFQVKMHHLQSICGRHHQQ